MEPDEILELVGHPNGFVLEDGETITYEYNDQGQFTGWHKAPGSAGPHPTGSATDDTQEITRDPNEPPDDPPNPKEGE